MWGLIPLILAFKITIAHAEYAIKSPILKSILDIPPNTDCALASSIDLGRTDFDNTEAYPNSATSCAPTWRYLWYKWTSTFTGYLQASTCNSADFDTVLAVYNNCADFPEHYNNCSDDYCGEDNGNSLFNTFVNEDQVYYIALSGYYYSEYPDYGYGVGILKLSQATLSLTLISNTVGADGGPVNFIASTTATDNFKISINVICGKELVYQEEFTTSLDEQSFEMPAHTPGICSVQAVDRNEDSFTSNTEPLVVGASDYLTITKPQNGLKWPVNEPLEILVTAEPSATGVEALIIFFCPIGDVPKALQINKESTLLFDSTYGTITCVAIAETPYQSPSEPVSLTFTVPTFIITDLKDWQGGREVIVKVETYNHEVISITLNVNCPGSSASYQIMTETDVSFILPGNMSGVDCLITTTDMPTDYLPIIPQKVVITLSNAAKLPFIWSIFSPAFSPAIMARNNR